MRVLQLIDSLEAGGAERMAVNYANALVAHTELSALAVSRKEGPLRKEISKDVPYLFLERNSILDFKALWRLRKFVVRNKVEWIHAHSTSFFMAVLLKLVYPKIKILWHDHYGNSEFLGERKGIVLKLASLFFSRIIVVNDQLKQWAKNNLYCKSVVYFSNFVKFNQESEKLTVLEGEQGKRIVCLANLREQKNHDMLLDVAKQLRKTNEDWTFHLIGKDFQDDYSAQLNERIKVEGLQNQVFVYGSKSDISNILHQASVGILTSKSEGLPVALLEYGFNRLPVVVTAVGEIPSVIQDSVNGFMVGKTESKLFCDKLTALVTNENLRSEMGDVLFKLIKSNYTEEAIIEKYLNLLIGPIEK